MNSPFEKWFVSQHGQRRMQDVTDTDESLRQSILAGERDARELKRRKEWDARRESALRAWNARGDSANKDDT